ncbi:conserved Plasmodium protein, unknown function [Plasmodium malariae]|uniref:Uncharacterized protein n=1 Tax=Plasmodium malariae TaxID=5858 RepID=A0A1A8WCK9_PLAMA|nr:conserved Plasmodium protein, unknown function [Plasmodium malariae]
MCLRHVNLEKGRLWIKGRKILYCIFRVSDICANIRHDHDVIILALYNKVKYENVGVNYYSSENNNGGSSSERSRRHGSDSSKGSYNGCELSDDYCSVDYIGDIKETQGSKIVSYKDTRINKVKKTFSQMFHPIFSEMNYESTVVIIIKYIYLPTINDCVINALTQTLKCKNDETNEQYSILNDNEFVELIHSDDDSYNRHSEKKKKNLEATRKEKEDKQETVCKSDKREKIAGRVALEEEVKDEGKNKVKDEVKHEVKNEVKHEVKNEVKHEVKNEVKHEVKNETGGEVMDEVVDKVKEKVMDKVEDKIEDALYDEKTDDVQEAEEIKETKYTNDEHETSEVTGKKVSNMDKRKNNKNDEDEISSRVKSSKKKKLFSFKLDNLKFIPKKKKKEKMKIERSMEIECIDNKENNYESLDLSKTDNENNVICYDVSILLEYWLFINILKFLNLFFFFRKYNKGSFMFEYFTLFVICINISEKLHEFMFLKNYKSSILVRFLKKFLVSTVDFLLYSLFNIRLESEDKKGKNGTDPNLKYAERSNILIKLSKIVKEKLKLNETFRRKKFST